MSKVADVEEILLFLLGIDSLTGQEQKICSAVRERFKGSQLRTTEQGMTTAFFFGADNSKPTIAFYGHLDTVTNQQSGPPKCEGGKIYGCGASDMKGGLAVMVALMDRLSRGDAANFNTQFIFYDAEEGPGADNGLNTFVPDFADQLKCDLALVMEPTNNEIQQGCVGSVQSDFVIHGKSAHSARPWHGINAIQRSWPLLKRLDEAEPKKVTISGLDFYEVKTATLASGGQTRNSVPAEFRLNVNYRFAPGKTTEQASAELIAFAGKDAEVIIKDSSPSGIVIADNPYLDKLISLGGLKCEPKQAWTDVARLCAHGIPAVNFGPGDTAQAHQADEYILADALRRSLELTEAFLFN